MKILALGEVMLRLMPPDYKQLSQVTTLEFLFSGTGLNILSGLHQMGDTSYLVTVLPNNNIGRAASCQIRALGINDTYIRYKSNHIGTYILEQGFGPRASTVTYLNRNESSFGISTLADFANLDCLKDMDALHLCGITLALNERTRETAFAFARKAKELGIPIIFDCNFRPTLWNDKDKSKIKALYTEMLHLANIVFATEKDAELLLEFTAKNAKNTIDKREKLLKQMQDTFDIEAIFGTIRSIKKNKQYLQGFGVIKGTTTLSPTYLLEVYDRIGGGDAFAASCIHMYLQSEAIQTTVDFATASGVLGHTTYGDSPILSKTDILNFMEFGKQDVLR
jgi:Sugar kinases, ribokinase family